MLRIAVLVVLTVSAQAAIAQHGFVPVDTDTEVSGIGFDGNDTFQDRELRSEVVTSSPSFLTPLLFWKTHDFRFQPAELQKDVHRLTQFYIRQGFPDAVVDYVSELDSAKNKLDITFTVEEGDPLMLQSVEFLGPDGRQAAHSIAPSLRSGWDRARRENSTWRIGERPTLPDLFRIQADMNLWLRNNGYAFSEVGLAIDVDTVGKVLDATYSVDSGPLTRINKTHIEWLSEPLFDDHIIIRQLPFKKGDLFSQDELSRGQRGLFNLNVFRFALVDVPTQKTDSTADVRVRVERGDLNVFRAETGYALEDGFEISGEYTRRNFLGAARRLTVSGILNTGVGERATDGSVTTSRRRLAVSVFQPYFFRRSVSGLLAVFYDRLIDRAAQEEQLGGGVDVLYEFKAYRTLTTGIAISRVRPLTEEGEEPLDDFIRGTLSSNAIFGTTDDRLSPTEGYLIRPNVEIGSPLLLSEVEYFKAGLSGSLYKRIGRLGGVAFRLFRGGLWPGGGVSDEEAIESERFDRTRYYAGGSDDVRGWAPQLLGPKETRIIEADTLWDPQGRLDKWLANLAYRFPLPITPPEVQWAVFADGAQLGEDAFRVGAGAGIRYRTPVGFIRLDVAYKVNPSPEDLRDPADVVRLGGIENVPPDNGRRLRFHFGIGQAF